MQIEKVNSYFHKLLLKIHDPGYKGEAQDQAIFNMWPVRVFMLIFLFVNFHVINKGQLINLDLITIMTEFSYLIYVGLTLIFTKKRFTPEMQFLKLMVDLFFITVFEILSLIQFGIHSWMYVLFFIPIIFCSFRFNGIFTLIFTTFVSGIYSFSNYSILNLGEEFETFFDSISMIVPVVAIFYLVAVGSTYFKQKIRMSYKDVDKRVEAQTAELIREKEYTRNLLRSSFDAIITVDSNGKISEINERARELLGYDLEDIITQNVKNIYALGEVQSVMNNLLKSEDGSIENFNTFILNKSGEKIPILLSASLLYDRNLNLKKELSKGKKFSTVGYFRDIRAEEAVDNIAKEITSITDEKTLLDKIVKIVVRTLKAEACSLLTYSESNGMLKVITSYGMPDILKKNEWVECYGEKESMTAQIFSSKHPLNISNIDIYSKQPQDISIKWKYAQNFANYSRFGDFKHFLGTPLFVQGEIYGIIRAINKYRSDSELDKQGFTEKDMKLLVRISNQVSILIEKVRDRERFEAILKVGRELNEMVEVPLNELLEIIAKEVVKGMRFKACYLRLIEDNDNLKIKACYGLMGKYTNNAKYILKIGEGISGDVVRTGENRAVEDLRAGKEFEFKEIIEKEELRSMLSVPLKYRSRVIGVINCYTHRIHKFTEQEIQIMDTFATYASTAIQNKKRVDELYAINEIGSELVKPIKIAELIDLVLERAKALSGADRLCIKTYDERNEEMNTVRVLNCPWYEKNRNFRINIREGLEAETLGKIINDGNSRIISKLDEIREKLRQGPDWKPFKKVKSCALIPIKIDKKVFGIIFLDSYRENFFTEDDLLVLEAFSSQAAIALRNANLFDKLQKVTETFPGISELDTDVDRVLQNIAKIAAEVLETDILLLYRWDEEHEKIIWPPIYSGNIKYEEFMMSEEDCSDIPMDFIKEEKSHYAEYSQKDNIMTSKGKPPKGDAAGRFVYREGIVSSAGIILKVGLEKVGVMFINYRTHHKFDEDERRIIENYASYIAIATQNVKHFSEKQEATAMQTLGQLAASIAHKMKNDIGTISLYTGDLIEDLSPKSPSYFSLSQIKEKVRKISSDINNLLIASKKKIPEKRFINIKNLINEIEKEIMSDLIVKNIELEKKIAANIPNIKIDPAQVKMVLSNLAYNSIEAMPNSGRIVISISKLKHVVLLEWKDTGKGVPPENAEKVLQPFWTTKNKGFGLGLFLSKTIIEEHGGSISLDTKYKKGANFVIKFPIKEQD